MNVAQPPTWPCRARTPGPDSRVGSPSRALSPTLGSPFLRLPSPDFMKGMWTVSKPASAAGALAPSCKVTVRSGSVGTRSSSSRPAELRGGRSLRTRWMGCLIDPIPASAAAESAVLNRLEQKLQGGRSRRSGKAPCPDPRARPLCRCPTLSTALHAGLLHPDRVSRI